MYHVTSLSQWWQHYMNCTSNCSRTHPILQIWPWQLLAVCRRQKNTPDKEICLQWRSDIRNWGAFCGQRHIILQKRHWIVREALESVYHPRRRLLMNKVAFCLRVVVLLVKPRTYWVLCYLILIILLNTIYLFALSQMFPSIST